MIISRTISKIVFTRFVMTLCAFAELAPMCGQASGYALMHFIPSVHG